MSIGNVHPKISREFSRRLDLLQPQDKVRAIVLLRAEGNGGILGRLLRSDRQNTAEQFMQAVEDALPEIDQILQRYQGRRMAEHPSAVGAIPVETTAGGVIALARADCVKTIFEDQNILPLS